MVRFYFSQITSFKWYQLFEGGTSFPGVRDLMHDFDKLEEDEKMTVIEQVKKHLSDIMIVFRQAKRWLEEDKI